MWRKSPSLLSDAIVAADLILRHTADRTLDEYVGEPWFRSAVERNYEIIGEAIRIVERQDPEIAAMIPDYREIIDFRNRIAHGYYSLDHVRVWRYTKELLPGLRSVIAAILDDHAGSSQSETAS